MAIDELVDIAQILQQFPGFAERRGDQLDEGLGEIRRDVLVREGGAEGFGMPRLHDVAGGRDAQRLLFDALAPAAQYPPFTGIDEPREAALELLIDHVTQTSFLDCPRRLWQLRNHLDFNEEPRVDQTLHLNP